MTHYLFNSRQLLLGKVGLVHFPNGFWLMGKCVFWLYNLANNVQPSSLKVSPRIGARAVFFGLAAIRFYRFYFHGHTGVLDQAGVSIGGHICNFSLHKGDLCYDSIDPGCCCVWNPHFAIQPT